MEFVALELATETGEHLMMSIVLSLTVALVPRRLLVFLPELKSPPGYAHFFVRTFLSDQMVREWTLRVFVRTFD